MLLVNLLAALNFANVFLNKNVWKIKNAKNVTKIKKRKTFFTFTFTFMHHIDLLSTDWLHADTAKLVAQFANACSCDVNVQLFCACSKLELSSRDVNKA